VTAVNRYRECPWNARVGTIGLSIPNPLWVVARGLVLGELPERTGRELRVACYPQHRNDECVAAERGHEPGYAGGRDVDASPERRVLEAEGLHVPDGLGPTLSNRLVRGLEAHFRSFAAPVWTSGSTTALHSSVVGRRRLAVIGSHLMRAPIIVGWGTAGDDRDGLSVRGSSTAAQRPWTKPANRSRQNARRNRRFSTDPADVAIRLVAFEPSDAPPGRSALHPRWGVWKARVFTTFAYPGSLRSAVLFTGPISSRKFRGPAHGTARASRNPFGPVSWLAWEVEETH
jgi:hypothetical protein